MVGLDAGAAGIDRDVQRAQAAGNADPGTIEGARSPGAALENSRAGAGTGEPEPARVPAARTDEGDPEGIGRIRRLHAGDRRASQESGRSGDVPRSQERARPGTEAAVENDAGFRGVHGFANLSRMDGFAPLEQVLGKRGNAHYQGARDARRNSRRSAEGEREHP